MDDRQCRRLGQRQGHLAVGVDLGGRGSAWPVPIARDATAHGPRPGSGTHDSALRLVWRRRRWITARRLARRRLARGLDPGRAACAPRAVCAATARRVRVISDAEAALLGALGGRPGVLVLAGTGSIVLGRDERGRWSRAGGWVRWSATRARASGSAANGSRRGARRAPRVHAARGARQDRPIAALAPRVIALARRGDPRALRIVREGQRHLAARALEVARALRLPQPVDAGWPAGCSAIRGSAPGRSVRWLAPFAARWHRPAEEPVVAAARLAAARARVTARRLVITVCPRELGVVTLPVARGGRAVKLSAAAILRHLAELVTERGSPSACGCARAAPAAARDPVPTYRSRSFRSRAPASAMDHVAVAWKTYVYSLASLECWPPSSRRNLRQPERLNCSRGTPWTRSSVPSSRSSMTRPGEARGSRRGRLKPTSTRSRRSIVKPKG